MPWTHRAFWIAPLFIGGILALLAILVRSTRLHHIYSARLAQSRCERLFLASVGFFTAVLVVRGITLATHYVLGIFHDVSMGELALWLNLRDVYWQREGRESFEALALFGGLLAIGLFASHSSAGFFRAGMGRSAGNPARSCMR